MNQEGGLAGPEFCEDSDGAGVGFSPATRFGILIALAMVGILFAWRHADPSDRIEAIPRTQALGPINSPPDVPADRDFISGMPHFDGDIPPSVFDPTTHPDWRLKTLIIEDIRVGMRVPALNPEGSTYQNDAVTGERRPIE